MYSETNNEESKLIKGGDRRVAYCLYTYFSFIKANEIDGNTERTGSNLQLVHDLLESFVLIRFEKHAVKL